MNADRLNELKRALHMDGLPLGKIWKARCAELVDALDELEAELAAALNDADETRSALADEEDAYCRQHDLRQAAEAELERLTVGRATLEDQTNRAELAEARVKALEAALRWYASRDGGGYARAALVLSGGSE